MDTFAPDTNSNSCYTLEADLKWNRHSLSESGPNPLSSTITPGSVSAMCHQDFLQAVSGGHLAEYRENNLTILCGSLLHLPLVQYVNKHNKYEDRRVIDHTQLIPSVASCFKTSGTSRLTALCWGRKRDSAGLRHHSGAKHRRPISVDSQSCSAFSPLLPFGK